MKKLVLIAIFALPGLFAVDSAAQTYIRKSAMTPGGKADLQAMRKAFAIMRKLPCDKPISWYYQGAMHHIPDTIRGKNHFCDYQNPGDLHTAWNTCPHMQPGAKQFHFLTWHRLYIHYMERIIRKLSGKKDFALPYWNYNNPRQRYLPEELIMPSGYDANSLYELSRSPSLMSGYPINDQAQDQLVTNTRICIVRDGKTTCKDTIVVMCSVPMGKVLDTAYLWDAGDIKTFSSELEDGIHNVMHDYIGGAVDSADALVTIYNRIYQSAYTSNGRLLNGMMSDVPSAGFDPVFFLHHSNIDRLWMSWENSFPSKRLTRSMFEKAGNWPYLFFDENGKLVMYRTMQEVFTAIRNIDYTYDYMGRAQQTKLFSETPEMAPASEKVIGHLDPNLPLTGAYAQFYINLSSPIKPQSRSRYILQAEISVAGPTDDMVGFSINDADSKIACNVPRKNFAGLAGMFGVMHHHSQPETQPEANHGSHGHGSGEDKNAGIAKTLTYDITDEIRAGNLVNPSSLEVTSWLFRSPRTTGSGAVIRIRKLIIKESTP